MEVRKHLDLLGREVADKVTGFSGVVTSISFDLYGCIQAVVIPAAGEAGKQEDGRWYDVSRLKVGPGDRRMPRPDFTLAGIAEGLKGPADKPSGKWQK